LQPDKSDSITAYYSKFFFPSEFSIPQNSFLDIGVYWQNINLIMTYFSGGGDILQYECPDMTLFYVNITGLEVGIPSELAISSVV
jgi:hypothetical protein